MYTFNISHFLEGIDKLSDAIICLDKKFHYVYVNEAAEYHLGKSRNELIGKTVFEVFPRAQGTLLEKALQDAVHSNVKANIEEYYPTIDGWYRSTILPGKDLIVIHAEDISELKASQKTTSILTETLESIMEKSLHTYREKEPQ